LQVASFSAEVDFSLLFRLFRRAFHAFTQSKDRDSFQTICSQLTPQFASISQRINQCEADLRSSSAPALADLVRRIQVLEKTHLESVFPL
jgi:hypothetical protein